MKVLVTGGAGFIGSFIVDLLVERGDSAVVVDDLSTGKMENLNPAARFERISIVDPALEGVFERERPEIVAHAAAQVSVSWSVRNALKDAETNILGSINLFECCARHGVKKVVYSASGGTYYGEVPEGTADESRPPRAISPYGISKQTVEHYLNFYRMEHGLNYVTLRYGNVYGPRQDPHGEAGVAAIFSKAMLSKKRPVIFGDGSCRRDYVFVTDVARANLAAIDGPPWGIYNIGTSRDLDVNEMYRAAASAAGYGEAPEYGPPRPGDLKRNALNATRAAAELNWRPRVSFEEGMRKTVDFFRTHPER